MLRLSSKTHLTSNSFTIFCFRMAPRRQGRQRVWAGGGGVDGSSGVDVLPWPAGASVQEPKPGLGCVDFIKT